MDSFSIDQEPIKIDAQTLVIRELVTDDIPQAVHLYVSTVEHMISTGEPYFAVDSIPIENLEHYLQGDMNNPNARIYVAVMEQTIVGMIVGRIVGCKPGFSKVKIIGELGEGIVLPPYRHQGVMKRLEAVLLDYFRSCGAEYVELDFFSANQLARDTWHSLGYRTFIERCRKPLLARK